MRSRHLVFVRLAAVAGLLPVLAEPLAAHAAGADPVAEAAPAIEGVAAQQARIADLEAANKELLDQLASVRAMLQRANADLAQAGARARQHQDAEDQLTRLRADLASERATAEALEQPRRDSARVLAYLEESLGLADDFELIDDTLSSFAEGSVYALDDAALFQPGSPRFTRSGGRVLRDLALRLAAAARHVDPQSDWTLEIAAFADDAKVATGSARRAANETLAMQRARAIAAYLGKSGVPAERLQPEGLGLAYDVTSDPADAAMQSERIEFRFTVAQEAPPPEILGIAALNGLDPAPAP